jgi:tetratricopeptide (TPR) repeat protein
VPPRLLACAITALALGCAAGGTPRPVVHPAAAAREPSPALAALARGRVALAEGRRGDAERLCAEAARLDPADPQAHLALARVRLADVHLPAALAAADQAVALQAAPEALLLRGRILGTSRRFDDAAQDLTRALELDPSSAEGWALLSAVEVNRGDDVAAARAFGEVARVVGRGPAVELVWPTMFAMAPDPAQPQESLDRCLRGLAAQLDGRWDEALREQTAALRHARHAYWCGAGIAESLRRLGDLARAEALYRGVVGAFPEGQGHLRADAQGRLAALLLELGRPPAEAIALAREALARRGDRAALLETLGRACHLAGEVACARDAWQRLLRRPNLPEAMRADAEARLQAGGGAAPISVRAEPAGARSAP